MLRPAALLRHLTALYVEDDPIQRADMEDLLHIFFHKLLVTQSAEEALSVFTLHPVQVMIVDIRMPGMSGLELIAKIRQHNRHVAIIVTTAYAETPELLAAVPLHLVDYLLKPITWERLKQTLDECAQQLLDNGRIFVQLDSDTLYCTVNGDLQRQGQAIQLTVHEKRLLDALIAHRGQWLHYERLLTAVYDDPENVGTTALKHLVSRLRQKIGAEVINNQYGMGYRLC